MVQRSERPAGRDRRWSFEARLFVGSLLVAVPAVLGFLILALARGRYDGTFWLLAGAVALSTLAAAARLRGRVVFSLYTLSNLLEALREGDYSLRGSRARRGDAIGEVIWEVNTLSQTLRDQRLRVEETSALLGKIMAAIDIAILSFDAQRRLRLLNPAGERLLAAPAAELLGRSAEELELGDCLAVENAATLKRSFPGGGGRWDVRRFSFREGGLPHDLVVLTDLSRALREEERQAWQRLIRVLGHELNNSLAPIRSMASTLRSVVAQQPLPQDWNEDLRQGLDVIGDRAEALTRFMAGYTSLARLPPPRKRVFDLAPLVGHVAALEQRVPVQVDPGPELQLHADPDQIEQALINLVKNAAEASQVNAGTVRVRWQVLSGGACVEVLDEGPGIGSTENLFVPFFTTKPGGSGIGLVLARQIVESHGGSLSLENRRDGNGCVARVVLPGGLTTGDR